LVEDLSLDLHSNATPNETRNAEKYRIVLAHARALETTVELLSKFAGYSELDLKLGINVVA